MGNKKQPTPPEHEELKRILKELALRAAQQKKRPQGRASQSA